MVEFIDNVKASSLFNMESKICDSNNFDCVSNLKVNWPIDNRPKWVSWYT